MTAVPSLPKIRPICRNHPAREAAARCVSCGQHFCRECVTPVERRMLCAECFKSKTKTGGKKARDWFVLSTAAQLFSGLLVLWFTVYLMGRVLVSLPSAFHEGTVWEKAIDR